MGSDETVKICAVRKFPTGRAPSFTSIRMTHSPVNWFETWCWLWLICWWANSRTFKFVKTYWHCFLSSSKIKVPTLTAMWNAGQEHPLKQLFNGLFHPHLISQNVQILSGILEIGIWRILQAKKWYFTGHLSIRIENSKFLEAPTLLEKLPNKWPRESPHHRWRKKASHKPAKKHQG